MVVVVVVKVGTVASISVFGAHLGLHECLLVFARSISSGYRSDPFRVFFLLSTIHLSKTRSQREEEKRKETKRR